MQLQTILTLLAAVATTPTILATPLSLQFTSLQPRSVQSESCQHMGLSIAAILDQLDGNCNAKCHAESNKALEVLTSVQKKFPCGE